MKSKRKVMIYGLVTTAVILMGSIAGIGVALINNLNESLQETTQSESEESTFQGIGTIVYEWTGSTWFYYILPDHDNSNIPNTVWRLIPLSRLTEEFEQNGLKVIFKVKHASVYGIFHQGLSRKDMIVEVLEIKLYLNNTNQPTFTFSSQEDKDFNSTIPHPLVWNGIEEIEWINDNSVSIKAYAYHDAWDATIIGGGFRIENDTIYLTYTFTWQSCVRCSWYGKHDLYFMLENLEKGDYNFKLEGYDIGSCKDLPVPALVE